MKVVRYSVFVGALIATGVCHADETTALGNWPQWRGPLGTGVGPHADPPAEWSEDEHVRWKVALPGRGHSTPIIWENRIFLTTAVPYGEQLPPRFSGAPGAHDNVPVTQRHRFVVLALNRRDGSILWQKAVHRAVPHAGGHYTGSLASSSPLTDGTHVFAFFGSFGLYCLTMQGELVWKADLGKMNTKHGHGEGASPALYGQTLIANFDHEGQSFIAAFDKQSGNELWRNDRDEVTSWATPLVVQHGGKTQVIVCGTERVRGYDLQSGEVIWECGGMAANVVATPVAGKGMVFAGSSYEKRVLLAIRLDGAAGDITGSEQVVWKRFRGTPYVPSPLLYGDALYFLTHYQGILTRVEAKTGKAKPGAFRLGAVRNVYASPVAAAGKVYITGLDGVTVVISNEAVPRLVAVNRLDDRFSASGAVVGDELFLRGEKYLYCLASP